MRCDAREAYSRSFNSGVMARNCRGIAGLFAPYWRTLGILLLFLHGLLITPVVASPSPQGQQTQTQRPTPNPTACAKIGRATGARLAASPTGQFRIWIPAITTTRAN